MIELFRYIEQSFVVPPANIDTIDVSDTSDFQKKLRSDLKKGNFSELRKEAENFIEKYSVGETSLGLGKQYLDLHKKLLGFTSVTENDIKDAIEKIFQSSATDLVSSLAFRKDKQFLNDLIVGVKMVTGFDKVRANDLVAMRQAIAFIDATTEENYQTPSLKDLKSKLHRPIVIPSEFLKIQAPKPSPEAPPSDDMSDQVQKDEALKKEYNSLKAAYDTLMSLRPDELHMIPVTQKMSTDIPKTLESSSETKDFMTSSTMISKTEEISRERKEFTAEATRQVLALKNSAIHKLDPSVMKMLERESVNVNTSDYGEVLRAVKIQKKVIYDAAHPCERVKTVTTVYRVGLNAFAVKIAPGTLRISPSKTPDFSHAITRPIGVGNLLVVRQELQGYEAKEISHIENILEGEILRHSTTRSESNEIITTEEMQTTQFEERDLQSTIRNEMVSESQKEAGQQSSSVQDQTTSTSYGKLVENSKSTYAKTVTDRAVSSLSQKVRHERIQREKKTFIEKSVHEFDNSKDGSKNVTGIYQWVDKKYKTRIMNYGTRLLYDVVVPEPAAFLIESLKNAPQPEGLELIKPDVFDLCPSCLNEDNYSCLAAKYGVSGSVIPPPDEFLKTFAKTENPSPKEDTNLNPSDYSYFTAFCIDIPEGYRAVSGYVQRVNATIIYGYPYDIFELFIGEHYFKRFATWAIPDLNDSFDMNGETGQIPVTLRSYSKVYRFNFAIGINCQRTDKVFEQWQLKTHAAIMNGYNRQLADYQDKLSKFQAIIRSQVARASNYAHNPSIEQAELKKAFIYLLLSEHFGWAYIPAPYPTLIPPDPTYIKNWGAMVAFFERAFEWENIMYTYYPYFWGRQALWGELILIQDLSPQFEEFLKAGAARVVVPVRPGFEAAVAHYQETGYLWMGEEIPDMFSLNYVSILQEIKARNFAPKDEVLVEEWDVRLPTTLVMLKGDAILPDFSK